MVIPDSDEITEIVEVLPRRQHWLGLTLIRHHGELKVLGRNQAMRMLLEISANSTAAPSTDIRNQISHSFDRWRISQIVQRVNR